MCEQGKDLVAGPVVSPWWLVRSDYPRVVRDLYVTYLQAERCKAARPGKVRASLDLEHYAECIISQQFWGTGLSTLCGLRWRGEI